MRTPIVATKLYIPPPRPNSVERRRLLHRLRAGLRHKLTVIAAPAGFGKTTLLSAWAAECGRPVAWLALDAADSDPIRFLRYLVAAMQTFAPELGTGIMAALQAPQPPPTDVLLSVLLNDIATLAEPCVLVLDDYHVLDAPEIDQALAFLIEHLPPQLHLVIASREDPPLPLARLRARDQLTELRVADLRFTADEAAAFLNHAMRLQLTADDIAALETRTEGWIAGLQLAALSLRGQPDAAGFIASFTGSHHFVVDYLVAEVLSQQPERIQRFLLNTSILDRLCGPLCDAVLGDPAAAGDATLERIAHANLFLVPLDDERRWYRYHQLFADVLRQRLRQRIAAPDSGAAASVALLHTRASVWYEAQGLELEAFQHAAAAGDIARAERLIEGAGLPLHVGGAGVPVLSWLRSLPPAVLDARPALWVMYASAVFFVAHQPSAVEPKLQAAEAALRGAEPDERHRDLVGRIASLRATLAIMQHDSAAIIAQSQRALEYLRPDNLSARTAATYTLGYAQQLQGDRAAARRAYTDVIALSASAGTTIYTLAATTSLGQLQEADNQLQTAAETYRRVLQLAGDPPQPIACEAYVGLARIAYEWNDLAAAEAYAQQCLQLTRQMESVDTYASYGLLLARLRLAQGDVAGAGAALAAAEQFARQYGFEFRLPEIAAEQVRVLLHAGRLSDAAQLAQMHALPISQARVHLAQHDPVAALAVLEPFRRELEARSWHDELLMVLVLQALAQQAQGAVDTAVGLLGAALAAAAPGGFVRRFVDEGRPLAALLHATAQAGIEPASVRRLLAAFGPADTRAPGAGQLIEPLSERECEVLRLLGTELSGPEIARRLMVSLNTVRTHTGNIYSKLGVNSRRAAVRRAAELDLL